MKIKYVIYQFPLIMMGIFLLFTIGCERNDDDNDEITVTDIDGNVYHTVKIRSQVWMVENLKTTKYNDGNPIPLVTDNEEWASLSTPAYCWYDNDEGTYGNTYGALYNWYTINTDKLCPDGWHVPTNAEWTTLIDYLGGENVAGGQLKETDTTHWTRPNTGATNETGFTALPGSNRSNNGDFVFTIGDYGTWWSSTEYSSTFAWNRTLFYNSSNVLTEYDDKNYGFSVRCLKD